MRIAAIAVIVVALVAIGGFGLSTFVNGRDSASVSTGPGPGAARGEAETALGAAGDVGVAGNVVLLYSSDADGPPLRALADEITGPASPELEQAGQAVLVRQSPDAGGVVALSATRVLRADSAGDSQIRAFVESSLGNAESG
ncbi:MAG: hypothetical protein ACSLFR_17095 [Solirubrobacteraceae bacterium]